MDAMKKVFENLGPWEQIICAISCWVISHLNTFTGILAFLIAAYTFKTTWYKSKMEKLKYDKMVSEYQSTKNRRKQ